MTNIFETDISSDDMGDYAQSTQGDLDTSSGGENLTAALKRRFGTPYGSLFYDTTYGNKVFSRLSQPLGRNFEQEILTDARECILGDPRVQNVIIQAVVDREKRYVSFQISYISKDGTNGSFEQGVTLRV